jgi:hypothetical protein
VASFADNRFDRCDLLQRNVIHHGKSFPRGMRFSEHLDGDGETIFKHACKMGLEHRVKATRFPLSKRSMQKLGENKKSCFGCGAANPGWQL